MDRSYWKGRALPSYYCRKEKRALPGAVEKEEGEGDTSTNAFGIEGEGEERGLSVSGNEGRIGTSSLAYLPTEVRFFVFSREEE